MRKILAVCALACLVLCGCSKEDDIPIETIAEHLLAPTTEATAPATEDAAPTAPVEETQAPTEPDATVPEETLPPVTEDPLPEDPTEPEDPVAFRHPLTGAPLDAPYSGSVVAISIDNAKSTLPQYGISKADILFEIETEGDVTRFLTVFTDLANTAAIGPIRSSRTYFNDLAAAYNAPIAHCGGSTRGIVGYYDYTGGKISGWRHIDEQAYGKYFYRDYDRYNYQDYAWEHCLFTNGEKMQQALTKFGYDNGEGWNLGFSFSSAPSFAGSAATDITVTFLGGKTSSFRYNASTGRYSMSQYGGALMDAGADKQLSFRNVLVLKADQSKHTTGRYLRSYYDLIGSGTGYFAVDGKIVEICWSRNSVTEPFVYTLKDGSPLTFGEGNTYVGIVSLKAKGISYK